MPNTFRIIRGASANYKTIFYATRERRDERARHFADVDGETVLCEEWTEETMRSADSINAGWALDRTVEPSHAARPDDDPEPGDRCKDCGEPITWTGPTQYDWEHVS